MKNAAERLVRMEVLRTGEAVCAAHCFHDVTKSSPTSDPSGVRLSCCWCGAQRLLFPDGVHGQWAGRMR